MQYSIIDFHTHPFDSYERNICGHIEYANMSKENTKRDFLRLGVEKICGSVIEMPDRTNIRTFEDVRRLNNIALKLAQEYDGFYIPGFHIHPRFVKESIAEIDRMSKLGVRLIGELVPYIQNWDAYYDKNMAQILETVAHYKMVVSIHGPFGERQEREMDEMIKNHKDVVFVAAHPGEKTEFLRHLKRMEISENYHLDLSGTGLFRHGLLRHGIDEFGVSRFLYGSDYPTCNPAVFLGGVAYDFLLSEDEKKQIFYDNAARILKL